MIFRTRISHRVIPVVFCQIRHSIQMDLTCVAPILPLLDSLSLENSNYLIGYLTAKVDSLKKSRRLEDLVTQVRKQRHLLASECFDVKQLPADIAKIKLYYHVGITPEVPQPKWVEYLKDEVDKFLASVEHNLPLVERTEIIGTAGIGKIPVYLYYCKCVAPKIDKFALVLRQEETEPGQEAVVSIVKDLEVSAYNANTCYILEL